VAKTVKLLAQAAVLDPCDTTAQGTLFLGGQSTARRQRRTDRLFHRLLEDPDPVDGLETEKSIDAGDHIAAFVLKAHGSDRLAGHHQGSRAKRFVFR